MYGCRSVLEGCRYRKTVFNANPSLERADKKESISIPERWQPHTRLFVLDVVLAERSQSQSATNSTFFE
ncbi:hypothetical protein D3C80_121220 [compost metagenome]